MKNLRVKFALSMFMLCMLILVLRAFILMLGEENTERSDLYVMNRPLYSLTYLSKHIKNLESMMENIEDYKLNDIKLALKETVDLFNKVKVEFNAQYEAWIDVKSQISKDKSNFTKLREQIDQMQNIQDDQIVHLKALLDKANKPSIYADISSLTLSFLMGVFSSILATYILDWWKKVQQIRMRKEPER